MDSGHGRYFYLTSPSPLRTKPGWETRGGKKMACGDPDESKNNSKFARIGLFATMSGSTFTA